jgi:hypothetical protein
MQRKESAKSTRLLATRLHSLLSRSVVVVREVLLADLRKCLPFKLDLVCFVQILLPIFELTPPRPQFEVFPLDGYCLGSQREHSQ